MTTLRLDLRHLRLLLAVAAVALSLVAAAPQGAYAQPNSTPDATAGAKKDCEKLGGTWTIDGTTAYCKGRGWPNDYSCDLKINPKGTACSHLPKSIVANPTVKAPRGSR